MHRDDTRPDLGKIIAPQEEKEGEGADRDGQRDGDKGAAPGNRLFEQRTIAFAEPVEAAFESLLKSDEDVPRWFPGRLTIMVMRLRHGDPSSYISPWSAPACATG